MTLKFPRILAVAAIGLMATTSIASAQLRFWTTEEQPDRLAKQQDMAKEFEKETGTSVEVIPVTETDLGKRATAAFAAGDLPDVIYLTLQYVLPWSEAGILDTVANDEIVKELGTETFTAKALEMADFDGETAAVPSDGWTQMVLYRKDLFEEKGLAPPDSYANIEAAIKALNNPPDMYGFVAATKVDENFMSQVLEEVFLANGATPIKPDGSIGFDKKKLVESLNFYKTLAKASPPGDLYWQQSRQVYFAGKAAMIIWSPFILDELAGLRDSNPPTINDDPTSTELAEKTGIVTRLSGPSNKAGAAWGDVRYFGVTADADTDPAMEFVKFSLDKGYTQTLSIAPEGKFPVRPGTKDDPEKFRTAWMTLPAGVDRKKPLADIYSKEVINNIMEGLDNADRWGVKEGKLAEASRIINSQVINRLTREFIDGERDADATADMINEEIAKIQ